MEKWDMIILLHDQHSIAHFERWMGPWSMFLFVEELTVLLLLAPVIHSWNEKYSSAKWNNEIERVISIYINGSGYVMNYDDVFSF